MSIWLFRAGRNGEYESKFLEDKRIYLGVTDISNCSYSFGAFMTVCKITRNDAER